MPNVPAAEKKAPTAAEFQKLADRVKLVEAAATIALPSDLERLQGQLCPNCHDGVLIVTRYDPEALHEVGQNIDPDHSSGGAYGVQCFKCDYTDSRALNPGPKFGEAK